MSLDHENHGRPDLRKRVIERLEHSIKMGGYKADEKLPTEHELAAEFQVSRPIIRDVLQILREKGLIYSRQGSGSYVKSSGYKPPLSFTPIATRSDYQNYYQLRQAIEPIACVSAAERMNEADVIQLSLQMSDMQVRRRNDKARGLAEFQFHSLIAKASGNSFFVTIIEALKNHIAVSSPLVLLQGRKADDDADQIYQEHIKIYQALRKRDGEGAAGAMTSHLSKSLERVERSITL